MTTANDTASLSATANIFDAGSMDFSTICRNRASNCFATTLFAAGSPALA